MITTLFIACIYIANIQRPPFALKLINVKDSSSFSQLIVLYGVNCLDMSLAESVKLTIKHYIYQ